MRVGLCNNYSWRPHVEHLIYLATLLQEAGHETFFLTCDANAEQCYNHLLRQGNRVKECSRCMLGGVRTYPVRNVSSLRQDVTPPISDELLHDLALSSAATLLRIEGADEWHDPALGTIKESLRGAVATAYHGTLRWIEAKQLDAVILFNGRIDMTHAIMQACIDSGTPFISHERSWFADGLHLIPNASCLSLKELHRMSRTWEDHPLTERQVRLAAKLGAQRFLQRNELEWRLYNRAPVKAPWPLKGQRRVLIVPGSNNEVGGHPEWTIGWTDNTAAFDAFIEHLGVSPDDVVVRFHPNWAENIGRVDGSRCIRHYTDWCEKRGLYYVPADDKRSTYDLITQADVVALNNGSSAVEAGLCGKEVYCFGTVYDGAGFVKNIRDADDLTRSASQPAGASNEAQRAIIRSTLRYMYMRARRFPQYCDQVRAETTTRYSYFAGGDPERLIRLFGGGPVEESDTERAENEDAEDAVIAQILDQDWVALADFSEAPPQNAPISIRRRSQFGFIDRLRARMAIGDR